MAEMKFKFTIQPYQTEAVDSVVGVFAGQPFNDHFTYRRDVEIKRDVTNWMPSDEELYMGFANARYSSITVSFWIIFTVSRLAIILSSPIL